MADEGVRHSRSSSMKARPPPPTAPKPPAVQKPKPAPSHAASGVTAVSSPAATGMTACLFLDLSN